MKKKMCVLIMTVLMSISFSTLFVSAEEISPRGTACTCGGGLNLVKTTYDSWTTIGAVKCEKNNNYYDSKQKRNVHKSYKCNRCGYEVTLDSVQYRTLCTH